MYKIDILIPRNKDVNNFTKMLKLIDACDDDNANINDIKLLLENGNIDPNIQDEDGYTALMVASMYENIEIVKLLLYHDYKNYILNPNIQNGDGKTVLMISFLYFHDTKYTKTCYTMIKLLLNYSNKLYIIDPNIQKNNGCTLLTLASKHGDKKIVELLLDYNKKDECKISIDPNIQDKNGMAPIMWSIHYNFIKITELLMCCDNIFIDPNIKDNRGYTILKYAENSNNLGLYRAIKSYTFFRKDIERYNILIYILLKYRSIDLHFKSISLRSRSILPNEIISLIRDSGKELYGKETYEKEYNGRKCHKSYFYDIYVKNDLGPFG